MVGIGVDCCCIVGAAVMGIVATGVFCCTPPLGFPAATTLSSTAGKRITLSFMVLLRRVRIRKRCCFGVWLPLEAD
jgi:hypothetical protein